MTRDVPEETRAKSYPEQQAFVARHSNYCVPRLAEAAVAIFMEYVATGMFLYRRGERGRWTFIRCQEQGPFGQMLVGGFAPSGLCVDDYRYGGVVIGVAPLRK
jgi:hypothetical protein